VVVVVVKFNDPEKLQLFPIMNICTNCKWFSQQVCWRITPWMWHCVIGRVSANISKAVVHLHCPVVQGVSLHEPEDESTAHLQSVRNYPPSDTVSWKTWSFVCKDGEALLPNWPRSLDGLGQLHPYKIRSTVVKAAVDRFYCLLGCVGWRYLHCTWTFCIILWVKPTNLNCVVFFEIC
jgi:hypothetical protein